jgi:two-component system sensor histidine kinase MprB
MSLRRRMSLVCAITVAVAICLASVIAYIAVRAELRSQVDDVLRERANGITAMVSQNPEIATARAAIAKALLKGDESALPEGTPAPPPMVAALGGPDFFFQLIPPDGNPTGPPGDVAVAAPLNLPVDSEAARIAAQGQGQTIEDAELNGTHLRVLTAGLGDQGAVRIGSSLEGTDDVLARLRVILFLVVMGGIAVAALLARRVADRFNATLDALARSRAELADSVKAQRQLVADASHELRTPVASLRTDIEVLRDDPALDDEERTAMLGDVDDRVEELGALITDVIELARGDGVEEGVDEVRLDLVTQESVERARRHFPDRAFLVHAEPSVVEARPDRLARAINNLLDNAAKFSPGGTPVEVDVREGGVTVRDHGPGVPPGERDEIFDRFHRGRGSRATPGSGLGLAIVRQVAESHGGEVSVGDAPGGGAMFRLRLPEAAAPDATLDTGARARVPASP